MIKYVLMPTKSKFDSDNLFLSDRGDRADHSIASMHLLLISLAYHLFNYLLLTTLLLVNAIETGET